MPGSQGSHLKKSIQWRRQKLTNASKEIRIAMSESHWEGRNWRSSVSKKSSASPSIRNIKALSDGILSAASA